MILLLFATFIAFVLLGASILEELSLLSFLKDVQAKNLIKALKRVRTKHSRVRKKHLHPKYDIGLRTYTLNS
jgi:hypothetical protein